MTDINKWDHRFIGLAATVASWSKDPGTKVGAVIVRPDKTVASIGYNGFPRGCNDDQDLLRDRATKLLRTVHAEANAILHCRDQSLVGYTIYVWPMMPCANCAALIIQSGMTRVVAAMTSDASEHWREHFQEASTMFAEASVTLDVHEIWE